MSYDDRPDAAAPAPGAPETAEAWVSDGGFELDGAGIPSVLRPEMPRPGPARPEAPRQELSRPASPPPAVARSWSEPSSSERPASSRLGLERPTSERPGRAVRVMLVDDHALVRSAVSQAIAAPDLDLVAEAATAEDAFALALAVRPDIILLDIDLPGMNGLQMLEELSPRLPDTKIVMLTVSDSERDMLEALNRGAAGYLTKDLSPEALVRALRGAARGELAMSRRSGARAMRHFVEAARRGRAGAGGIIEGLSPRENDVLRMLADGLTDREIATALIISPRTVETHVSNILHKLDVRKRAEAAQRYRESL